jgi:hypothetical protein
LLLYICLIGFGGFGGFGAKQQSSTMVGSFGGFGTGIGGSAFGQGKTIFLPLVLCIKQNMLLKHR